LICGSVSLGIFVIGNFITFVFVVAKLLSKFSLKEDFIANILNIKNTIMLEVANLAFSFFFFLPGLVEFILGILFLVVKFEYLDAAIVSVSLISSIYLISIILTIIGVILTIVLFLIGVGNIPENFQ
jgi:hypothetical protein